MPPAKGGKGGSQSILSILIKMPFTVAWTIVHAPTSYLMWLVCDKIPDDGGDGGRGATWISKWIMTKPRTTGADQTGEDAVRENFQTFSKWLKEFRAVLIEYFEWKKPPKVPAYPKNEPGWYDPDTKQRLSLQDAIKQSSKVHSLERIRGFKKQGFHLLSPILPDLMVLGLVFYMFFKVELMGPDYLTTQVTCPVVSRARSLTASFDANLFYYWKQQFFTWCDFEDSYMRFIMDAWVRGVVTRTDNTLLVFQTLASAFLVGQVLRYTLVPFASFLYAILANLVHYLECQIEAPADPNDQLWKIHNFLWEWNGSTIFGADTRATYPPVTDRRTRPDTDPLEGLKYTLNRWSRNFWYYYEATNVGLGNLTRHLLMYVFAFRLVCIWVTGVGPFTKMFLKLVGFGRLIANQENWYAGASALVNEDLLRSLAAKFYLQLNEYGLKHVPAILHNAFTLWAIGVVLWVIGASAFAQWLVQHRRAFNEYWKNNSNNHQPVAAPPS